MKARYNYNGHSQITKPSGSDSNSFFEYFCANCDHQVTGATVALFEGIRWLQCPTCGTGSVYHNDDNIVHPTAKKGSPVIGLPERVDSAYNEARICLSNQAYTACELICRNILMYAAVDKKAKENLGFNAYLDYLEQQGYVTPPMKPWVALIREHGNKAAHELEKPDPDRAESTLTFTAKLLEMIYGMEYLTKKYVPEKEAENKLEIE